MEIPVLNTEYCLSYPLEAFKILATSWHIFMVFIRRLFNLFQLDFLLNFV